MCKIYFFLADLHNRSSEHKNARCFCFLMPFQTPFEHCLKKCIFLAFFLLKNLRMSKNFCNFAVYLRGDFDTYTLSTNLTSLSPFNRRKVLSRLLS